MCGEEKKYIQEAFDTNWVAPLGPNVDAFERSLEQYVGENKRICALVSGTAAIHLALIQLGVGSGDEVICQSFTFVATANPVRYLGATPVFIDSEKETWNMDPLILEQAIENRITLTGKKPKAIIPVHLYGMPARMDEIISVATRYEIPILEDAAEALGSTYKGRKCGTFGKFSCLSFNGNKIITTSGGGALVCSTAGQWEKTRFYATQARDSAPHYQHSDIGYNYRMSNICAGIGRGQMTALNRYIERRREIHDFYQRSLSNLEGISFLDNPSAEFNSNYWLTCIQIEPEDAGFTREEIQAAMDQENIETRPLWKPMHMQPLYASDPFYGDGVSEKLFKKGLCLPSSPVLSDDDLRRVTGVFYSLASRR
jgi:dTDP-4-amino-4,6-dideoxygalactose transaminase